MLLHEHLKEAARRVPEKVALTSGQVHLTYREISSRAESWASYLLANGIRRGDRVVVYLKNSPEIVIAFFGALEAGACVVIINPATQAERMRRILENCAPRFLVTTAERMSTIQNALPAETGQPGVVIVGAELEAGIPRSPRSVTAIRSRRARTWLTTTWRRSSTPPDRLETRRG